MAGRILVCSKSGGPAYRREGTSWKRFTPEKVVCGKVERVTGLKAGDVRLMTDVVIIKVRGKEYALPAGKFRIKGMRR